MNAPPPSAAPQPRADPRPDPLAAAAAEPWAHDFFQLLRRVEARHPQLPRLGTALRPADEPLRLGQAPELSFAPAGLHAVQPGEGGRPPRLEVRFLGLFGPNGPLPLHLTEYARERLLHHGDASFARFADLFHHRLLLLFYRAWAQAQPALGRDRGDDDADFGAMLGALVGQGLPELRRRDAAPDAARLHFAGLLARQVRSADGLAAMLGGVLGRPVRIEQFAGRWMALDARARSRLGHSAGRPRRGAALGRGAVLGRLVWDRQHHVRLHVGPLDRKSFDALLPGGPRLAMLGALVRSYLGDEFGWELRLALAADQVPPTQLGRGSRLGWTSWLGRQPRSAPGLLTLRDERATAPLPTTPAAAAGNR